MKSRHVYIAFILIILIIGLREKFIRSSIIERDAIVNKYRDVLVDLKHGLQTNDLKLVQKRFPQLITEPHTFIVRHQQIWYWAAQYTKDASGIENYNDELKMMKEFKMKEDQDYMFIDKGTFIEQYFNLTPKLYNLLSGKWDEYWSKDTVYSGNVIFGLKDGFVQVAKIP